MSRFRTLFPAAKAIIGVTHLPPLPGFGRSPGVAALVAHALEDVKVLARHGVDGMLIENEHDRPHRVLATPGVRAAMMEVASAVVDAGFDIVAGCEILLNDPRASLDVAAASGARFIRSDYFVDRMSRREYGEFAIDPEGLIAHRDAIAPGVLVLADVQVKYATMLDERSLAESARIAALHAADAVVVTGERSGSAPTREQLREAARGIAEAGSDIPVLIGSGLDPRNAADLLSACEGAIVGTALMRGGAIDDAATARLVHSIRRGAAK